MPLPAQPAQVTTPNPTLPPGSVLPGLRADLGAVPFGLVDAEGVEWYVGDGGLVGWFDSPAVIGTTTKRPDDHGVWSGPTTLDMRTVTIDCRLVAPDTPSRDRALARLHQACPFLPTQTLRVDGTPSTQALVRRSAEIVATLVDEFTIDVTVPLLAPDPRRYATDLGGLTTTLPMPTGGVAPPLTPPVALPARPGGGYVSGTNAGNLDAPWVARIIGPMSGPRLTYSQADRFIAFDLDLAAGQMLVVDARARTAMLDGQVSRTATIVPGSSWWLLAPGPFEIRFTGSPTASGQQPSLSLTPMICWS